MQITDLKLKEQFDIQMELIKSAIEWFDKWDFLQAIHLAVSLRKFLHDTNSSNSLLNQLWVKDKLWYFDSSLHRIENIMFQPWPYIWLMQFVVGNDKVFALLDESPDVKIIKFDQRWNWNIFIDTDWTTLSRKDVVLNIANKIGAHVDLNFDASYDTIINHNSLWIQTGDDDWYQPITKLQYVAIRQITHELLKSMFENYKFKYTFEGSWYFMCINF